MATAEKKLFRKEALDRFSSPDDLEQLMPVARRMDWLIIVTTGLLLGCLVGWSVLGRIPTLATGRGVILRPRHLMQVQTTVAGQILALKVRVGDHVREGELIATTDQSISVKRIEENRRNLAALEDQDIRRTAAAQLQTEMQAQQDTRERAGLEAQRTALQKSLAEAQRVRPILQIRAESIRQLVNEKLLGFAAQQLSDGETAVRDNDTNIQDYTSRLGQIDGQQRQIETRRVTLARQFLDDSLTRRNEIDLIRRNIEKDEFQIRKDGRILSQYSGRVAEVMAAAGQVLPAGGRLFTVETEFADGALVSHAPGRHAAVQGTGNSSDVAAAASEFLESISYFAVRDGKKIQPGMKIQVTPDTVERERFGGILGRVISVSPIPVTKEGATSTIGNADVVSSLMTSGAYIEVRAQLETDPATKSGYRWSSSRGPDMKVTSGLTHATRVTIEGRAPITYLLPILRERTGVY